jgi:hypothetical protein
LHHACKSKEKEKLITGRRDVGERRKHYSSLLGRKAESLAPCISRCLLTGRVYVPTRLSLAVALLACILYAQCYMYHHFYIQYYVSPRPRIHMHSLLARSSYMAYHIALTSYMYRIMQCHFHVRRHCAGASKRPGFHPSARQNMPFSHILVSFREPSPRMITRSLHELGMHLAIMVLYF